MTEANFEFITDQNRLEEIIPEFEKFSVLSLDTETSEYNPFKAKLFLVQLATPKNTFVLDALKLNILPLKYILEAKKPLKIIQNAKFDYEVLRVKAGIKIVSIFDTMLAERILTCGLSRDVSLKNLAEKYLGVTLDKKIRESFYEPRNPAAKGKFSKEQLEYAAKDASILIEIFKKQLKSLEEEALIETAKLEFNLVPVVAEMELRGSLIDKEKWREHIKELELKRNLINAEIQKELKHLNPYSQVDLFGNEEDSINLDSPLQLLAVFKKLGLNLPNTSEATLRLSDHQLAKKLLEYRAYEKMITSFGESILEKINPDTGRLHPDFMQLGADTGRFTCNNPNLQQIPADSGFRSCFIASRGYKLITADYSQIELRIMAEVSEDPAFLRAFREDRDLHSLTASQMFKVGIAEVDKNRRFQAKSINFGLMYGRGPVSLANQIGLDIEESRRLLDIYFSTYKKVKIWLDQIAKEAIRNGYVRTLGGRKRIFSLPGRNDPDYQKLISSIQRQGKNTPIQGTSADITKYALIFIKEEFEKRKLDAYLIHTVHDEIVAEAREDQAQEAAKVVEEQMIRAGEKLLKKVPVKVDVNISDCWEKP